MAALRAAGRGNPFGLASVGLIAGIGQREEDRTEDEYRHEIESWAAACRTRWATALDAVAAVLTAPATITVTNREQAFLEDVEVEVHIEGPVRGLRPVSRQSFDAYDLLPSPPRTWGPWVDSSMLGVPNLASRYPYMSSVPSLPTVNFRNGGSVNIDVHVGDLRPRQVYRTEEDELALVVDGDDLTELSGIWKITARGHHAIYEGRLVVPVEHRDITAVMERLLRRLRKEDSDEGQKDN